MPAHARSARPALAWAAIIVLLAAGVLVTTMSAHAAAPASGGYNRAPIEDEYAMLALTNMARAEAGINPLLWNDQLGLSARAHSVAMAKHRCIDHTCGDGESHARIKSYYGTDYNGENVAGGGAPLATHNGFMGDTDHRANVLKREYVEFGAGMTYDDSNSMHSVYADEDFGSRGLMSIPPIPSGTVLLPATPDATTWQWQALLNFYDAGSKTPTSATAYVDGKPQPMTRTSGTKTNGTWTANIAAPGMTPDGFWPAPYCKRVYFQLTRSDGQSFRYPETGEMGLGWAPGCEVRTETQTSPPPPPPPALSVVIDAPSTGTHVAHNVQIRAHADGASHIEVWVDHKRLISKKGSTVVRGWNAGARSVAPGQHTITVIADGVSESVTVTK